MFPIKRLPSGGTSSTRIPIFSLSGGVSTQPPSKRTPLEAENLDNALITLERSAEKRPGFSIVPQQSFIGNNQITNLNRLDLFSLDEETLGSTELFWTWFSINENNRFLLAINYNATSENSILFYVYKINPDGTWVDITPTSNLEKTEQNSSIVDPITRTYITYGSGGNKAKDVLKVTTIGSSIIFLNTLVKAGFTSGVNGYTFNLDGTQSNELDLDGLKVTYYTSTRVSGSAGSLETNTQETNITSYSLTGNNLPASITIALPTPDGLGEKSNIVFANNTTPGSVLTSDPVATTHSQYFTGVVNATYNNNNDNLTFENTPANYKTTATASIQGNTLEGKTITNLQVGNTPQPEIRIPVVGTNPEEYPTTAQQNLNYLRVLVWIDKDKYFTGIITKIQTGPSRLDIKVDFVSSALKIETAAVSYSLNIAYECITLDVTSVSSELLSKTVANTNWKIFWGSYIPVEDFKYKDSAQPWLGQSFSDFSEVRFPPDGVEIYTNNSNIIGKYIADNSAANMLNNLYDPSHPLDGISALNGRGKIFYTQGPYLNNASGYYRLINFPETKTYKDGNTIVTGTGRPYSKKIRTPDICSIIDKKRMPQRLTFNEGSFGIDNDWSFAPVSWSEKTSGNLTTNPGPSVFLNKNKTDVLNKSISAIVTYRDRLFFACEDVIFSSQLGVYENLFLQDPSNIVSSDPIDIRASSKTFSEIISLTPFSDFLLINTKSDTQFELRGSENQITPLTAQIAPTSFYATTKLTEPLLMGSLIYFFSPKKVYVYISQTSAALSTAEDVSVSCYGYLPENIKTSCVCTSANTIAFVDNDKPNYLYLYTNKLAGDKVLQNSFFRYIIDTNDSIESMQFYDNYLHCIVKKKNTTTNFNKYYIIKTLIAKEDLKIPRIDNRFLFTIYENNNTIFYPNLNETVFYINFPYLVNLNDVVIVTSPEDSSWGENKYTILKPTGVSINNGNGMLLKVSGNYSQQNSKIYIGTNFKMNIELSEQFVRDQNNNTIDGVLNLRTLVIKHQDTGNYDVISTRRNKSIIKSSFNAISSNTIDTLSLENIQTSGEFVSKILGFSDNTKIQIISEYPTPVNIVNMEFKGKFKQTYTSLNT
jgi:hypothetical protein